MPCTAPRSAWRPATGGPLLFQPPQNGRAYNPIPIPCGTCILCRKEQARQQAIRVTHEAMQWDQNSFVTLTYRDAELPPHNSLEYDHLVRFWKRLRKQIGKLRYYAVGEYGDKSLRPHYHACIFGHAFTADRIIIRHEPHLTWTSPMLEWAWGHGTVAVQDLNFRTARYTASYVTKKLRNKQKYVRVDEETGELLALTQPRAFMSRNLGKEWWEQWHAYTVAHDQVVIDGQKQKPPKAYDKWLAAKDPRKMEEIKQRRKEEAIKLTEPETRARAKNAHAHVRQKNKSM